MSIDPTTIWDLDHLGDKPDERRAERMAEDGLEPLFLAGPDHHGEPTEIFAWYGQPEGLGPFPAMVLVHGGGGTAFPEWVRLWNARGYAAIALDTCGCVSGGSQGDRPRHSRGGPRGWGSETVLDDPLHDQWPWHATAATILAHSWLRTQDCVDEDRIGLTGISWGGVITCWASSADHRFACSAPVYGCGHLERNATFPMDQGDPRRERFLQTWDPSLFLPSAALPMLWVNGTGDFAFPLDSWADSAALPAWPATLSAQAFMHHNQQAGATPREILAFAEHHLRGGPALPVVGPSAIVDGHLRAEHDLAGANPDSGRTMRSAEVVFTTDDGPINQRRWLCAVAEHDQRTLHAELPAGATAAYLAVRTLDGLVISARPWFG